MPFRIRWGLAFGPSSDGLSVLSWRGKHPGSAHFECVGTGHCLLTRRGTTRVQSRGVFAFRTNATGFVAWFAPNAAPAWRVPALSHTFGTQSLSAASLHHAVHNRRQRAVRGRLLLDGRRAAREPAEHVARLHVALALDGHQAASLQQEAPRLQNLNTAKRRQVRSSSSSTSS